jgi:glc operon protein GlcG
MSLIKMKKRLTIAGADAVVHAAETEATTRGARVVIAVVDDGGKPIALRRLDHAQVASADVAVDKARTAAIFRRPSRDIEMQVRDGRFGALQLHGAVALQGGIPLIVEGDCVGADRGQRRDACRRRNDRDPRRTRTHLTERTATNANTSSHDID